MITEKKILQTIFKVPLGAQVGQELSQGISVCSINTFLLCLRSSGLFTICCLWVWSIRQSRCSPWSPIVKSLTLPGSQCRKQKDNGVSYHLPLMLMWCCCFCSSPVSTCLAWPSFTHRTHSWAAAERANSLRRSDREALLWSVWPGGLSQNSRSTGRLKSAGGRTYSKHQIYTDDNNNNNNTNNNGNNKLYFSAPFIQEM